MFFLPKQCMACDCDFLSLKIQVSKIDLVKGVDDMKYIVKYLKYDNYMKYIILTFIKKICYLCY